jgi:hypothetical protein
MVCRIDRGHVHNPRDYLLKGKCIVSTLALAPHLPTVQKAAFKSSDTSRMMELAGEVKYWANVSLRTYRPRRESFSLPKIQTLCTLLYQKEEDAR